MFGQISSLTPNSFIFAKFVLSLDSGVGADGVIKYKVPEHSHPGSVLRERVIVLCCNPLDLQKGKGPVIIKC